MVMRTLCVCVCVTLWWFVCVDTIHPYGGDSGFQKAPTDPPPPPASFPKSCICAAVVVSALKEPQYHAGPLELRA